MSIGSQGGKTSLMLPALLNSNRFDNGENFNPDRLNDDDDDTVSGGSGDENENEETIHDLVKRGDHDMTRYRLLKDRMATLFSKDDYGRCCLYYAAEYGHTEIVQLLVRSGASIDEKDADDRTPLHGAALAGLAEMCELLLDLGASIKFKDIMCRTPLHEAVSRNHVDAATLLASRGADLEAQELQKGRTPLHIAAEKGFATLVDQLIIYGSDMNSEKFKFNSIYTLTPLHLAVKNNHLDTVKVLIRRGADQSNLSGFLDKTPLHLASELGFTEVAAALVDGGSDLAITGECGVNGNTPLHAACEFGNLDTAQMLISKNASKFLFGKYTTNGCPLHVACEKGHFHIAKYLVETTDPFYVNYKDNNTGYTPLHAACEKRQIKIASYLIYNNADMTMRWGGVVPLDCLPQCAEKEDLRLLGVEASKERERLRVIREAEEALREEERQAELQRQRDAEAEQIRQVGIAEEYRKECLRVTEGCGELSAFAAVVDRYPGQDVNLIIDLELHKTALMICSDRGHDQLVAALLMWPGVDVECVDVYGNSALHVASKNGHKSIVERLLLAGARNGRLNHLDQSAGALARYPQIAELLRDPRILLDMGSNTALPSFNNNHTAAVVRRLLSEQPTLNADSNRALQSPTTNTGSAATMRLRSKASAASLGFNGGESDAFVDTLNNNSPETAKTMTAATKKFTKGRFGDLPSSFGGCRKNLFPERSENRVDKEDDETENETNRGNIITIKNMTKDQYKEWQLLEIERVTGQYIPDFQGELEQKLKKFRLSSLSQSDFPPTSFESTDQYCDIRDFLWLLGHPFRGAYSTTTDHAGGDKRCLLYRMAVVMNDLHSLIASNMHQTGAHTSLDQAPIARICLTFAYYFFDLFEPVDGWPLPPFLVENDFKPTVDDMYYLLSRLSQSSVITRDVEDSMNRILEFSDLQRYSGNSSSGTDDYNPYRYRRIVIDSVFDICDALKTKSEASYPIDSIRAHLWKSLGVKYIENVAVKSLAAPLDASSVMPDNVTWQGSAAVRNSNTTGILNSMSEMSVCDASKGRYIVLELWLRDLQLEDYFEALVDQGFKSIDDFAGLSFTDCREYFKFIKIGDCRRLSLAILQISQELSDSYRRKVVDSRSGLQSIPNPPPSF